MEKKIIHEIVADIQYQSQVQLILYLLYKIFLMKSGTWSVFLLYSFHIELKAFFFFLPSGHNKLENPDLMLKTHIFPFIPCLFQRSRQPFDNCLESRNASNLLNLKSHFTAQLTAAKSQTTLQYFFLRYFFIQNETFRVNSLMHG